MDFQDRKDYLSEKIENYWTK